MGMTIYEGSDGQYYTDWQVWRNFESNRWKAFCWKEDSRWEMVETSQGDLLVLNPISKSELPDDVVVEYSEMGAEVVTRTEYNAENV